METHEKSIHGADKSQCIDAAIKWIKAPAVKFIAFQVESNKNIYQHMPYEHNQKSLKEWESRLENIDKELQDIANKLYSSGVKPDHDESAHELTAEVFYCDYKIYVYEL